MEVQRLDKYPNLCKMVHTLLSCFLCPVVESSFSIMGNVMDETMNRLNIESLSAIQTIKYWLSAKNQSSIKTFQKEDYAWGSGLKTCKKHEWSGKSHEGDQSRRTRQKECINDKLVNNSSPCNFKEKKLKMPHRKIGRRQRKSCQTGKIRQIIENIKTLYIYQQHRDIINYHVSIFFH